jgi:LPS export ABC transporter protein LptC
MTTLPTPREIRPRRALAASLFSRFAAAFLAAALGASCGGRATPEPGKEGPGVDPEQVSHAFLLTRSEGGLKQWDLRAVSAEIFEGGDEARLKDLRMDFYDSTGAVSGRLTADKGRVFQKESRMEVEGNVVLDGEDGAQLRTERLSWSESAGRVTTDAYVEIDRAGERLTGYGLEATPDLTTAIVKKSVSVRGTRTGS